MPNGMTLVAMSSLAFTVATIVADRRSVSRRKSLDDVSLMPWTLLSFIGSVVTLFAVALAFKLH